MKRSRTLIVTTVCLLLILSVAKTNASVVGMGTNFWYTNTLENNLIGQGHTVNVVNSYNAASLSAFDVYIQDGNSHFDASALDNFVFNGGILIQLPWSQSHNDLSANTVVIGERTDISYGQPNPGISALDSGSWLLNGVALPAPGTHTIGREIGNTFVAGTQVLEWADGTAMLGYREYGDGLVVSFNLHLITSDASPLDAAWSNQIVYNAIGGQQVVPEPATLLVWSGLGLAAACSFYAKKKKRARQA
jgi:hypothetical protein